MYLLFLAALAVGMPVGHGELQELRLDYEAIERLEQRHAPETKEQILKKAADVLGAESVTYEQLVEKTTPPPGFGERVLGLFTFINIVWVTAAICLVGAICWLCGLYMLSILLAINRHVYEVLSYAACIGLIAWGYYVPETYRLWLAFPGCIGLIGAASLTKFLHFPRLPHDKEERYWQVWSFFLAAGWGLMAVVFMSQVLGFISVLALLSGLGFTAGIAPFCVFIGFKEDAYIARTTIVALVLTMVYVILEAINLQSPYSTYFAIFSPGLMFWGTFVYFLGLSIVSSKYYIGSDSDHYIPLQIATVLSGIAVLYLGSVLPSNTMLGIGGTFFYLYLLEKYFEIPWQGKGWAWAMLGLAGLLYLFAWFATKNPQYFLFM